MILFSVSFRDRNTIKKAQKKTEREREREREKGFLLERRMESNSRNCNRKSFSESENEGFIIQKTQILKITNG